MKLGNAKYGAEYAKKKYWKLKDGDSVFRILPPMGELADKGIWAVYHPVHYGYKNSEGRTKTFLSPYFKNRTNGMVERPDAALDLIENIKTQIEIAKKAGDKATVDRLQELAGGQKSRFNLDKNHYVNAMDTQGNIGVLKLRHKCKLALDSTIKSLRAQGIDPLSPSDGRFFVFRRAGNALETTFQVEIYAETIEVPGIGKVQKQVVHVLTQDIIDRLGAEAAELGKIFKKVTSEEVQAIVSSTDLKTGISKAVDAIFASAPDNSPEPDAEDDQPYTPPAAAPQASATPAATVQAAVITPAPQAAAPVAQPLPAYVAPVQQAAPAPTPAPAAQMAPAAAYTPPPSTAQAVAATSDLDFLKNLGVKVG